MKAPFSLDTPLSDDTVRRLRCGDRLLLNGVLYSARDAAHSRLVESIRQGDRLPFELAGQVIYYVGPSPPRPGMVIGAAGPTTSYRMDVYTPTLLQRGLKGMIGKGARSGEVIQAMKTYGAIYMGATGGAGALLSKRIRKVETVAYEDLGPEAVRRLEVEDFPVLVINDVLGNDLFLEGRRRYQAAVQTT